MMLCSLFITHAGVAFVDYIQIKIFGLYATYLIEKHKIQIWACLLDSNQEIFISCKCLNADAICCSNKNKSDVMISAFVSWFNDQPAKQSISYPKFVGPESYCSWCGCLSCRLIGSCKSSPMPRSFVRTEFVFVPFPSLVPYTCVSDTHLNKALFGKTA